MDRQDDEIHVARLVQCDASGRSRQPLAETKDRHLCAVSHFSGGRSRPLAPGAEPPIKTFRPSGYSTKTPTPLVSPLLAWYPKTLISVPTGKLVLVMPFLNRLVGGPPSIPQVTTLPSVPFTSSHSQEWGLINSTFVIVPCKLIGRFSSNAAANE